MNPFTGGGRTGQTTSFMPWRDGQREENFVLHQLRHIQIASHRQKIPGVVFQLLLRQFSPFRNEFQEAVDVQVENDRFQAALASQRQRAGYFDLQQRLPALPFPPLQPESKLSDHVRQLVMQALEAVDRQSPLENTTVAGKREAVRNPFQLERLRLKRWIIVRPRNQVKSKRCLNNRMQPINAAGKTMHPKLVLASTSPYRREVLARLGLPFEVANPRTDESSLPGESPSETALRLSEAKARAVAADYPDALIIGSDQVAEMDGRVFGNFDDPVLVNGSGFPSTSHFMPGDHKGCLCLVAPQMRSAGGRFLPLGG